jgi:hypothetical protein
MIGVSEKGPMNVITLVTSWEQFTTKFGSYIAAGYLAYAARAFFDNGGKVLYIVRTAHYTDITDKSTLSAAKSTITLVDRDGTPLDTLQVDAINEGAWGDDLSVEIEDGTLDDANEINLIVSLNGTVVEIFANLSMIDADDNYVELKINGVSKYITVEDLDSVSTAPLDRPAVGSSDLASGDDGLTSIDDADYIGDESQKLGYNACDGVDALNLVMVPGITTPAVAIAGLAYCEGRQDMFLIVDAPIALEPTDVLAYRQGTTPYSHAAFNSSYGGLYYPWIVISDPLSSLNKLIPPSGAVAGCYARSDAKTEVWYAPAGIDRGRIFNALNLEYSTSRGERDVIYPEGVNVIAKFVDSGINIWGQRTLQRQASSLDRVNVRRLMMYVEEAIAESSRFVVFEPNIELTWRSLIRAITPFLQGIADKGGFYDFRVQCDEETNTQDVIDRNEMVCRIFVQPVKTAEFVELNFILTQTGADFTEIYGS